MVKLINGYGPSLAALLVALNWAVGKLKFCVVAIDLLGLYFLIRYSRRAKLA